MFTVYCFQLSCSGSQIIAFAKRCLSLMQSFSVISANIAINHILLKLDSYVADSMGLSLATLA